MWWLIVLGVLLLLPAIPIGICGYYHNSEGYIWLKIGFIRILLHPRKSSGRKAGKKSNGTGNNTRFEEKRTSSKKRGGSLSDYYPLVSLVLDFLERFRRKLRINQLTFKMLLCDDDPCDLSIRYGHAWTVLGGLSPVLDRYFTIKKRDLEILCDYTATKTQIHAEIDLSITVGNILAIAGYHGFRFLRKFLKIMNKRKGGAMT